MKYARYANVFLGLWLFFAPWILGYSSYAAQANDHWVGIAIIVVAMIALSVPSVRFVNTLLGVWCIIAPFLLGYRGTPLGNDIVVGFGVAIVSLLGPGWEPTEEPTQARPVI
jgi:hypothetical protein